jgi:hypothetical protein
VYKYSHAVFVVFFFFPASTSATFPTKGYPGYIEGVNGLLPTSFDRRTENETPSIRFSERKEFQSFTLEKRDEKEAKCDIGVLGSFTLTRWNGLAYSRSPILHRL